MAQTVDRVIEVISKDSSNRLDNEIEAIAPWLRKRSHLLQGLEKTVLYDIIRNCYHQRSQKDDVIIRQGEIGEIFFIILRGTVSVYIDSQVSGEDKIARIGAPEKGVEIDKQSKKRKTASKPVSPVKNANGANRAKFGKFIVKFEPGKSFGEIALLTKGSIRNASIIVDEETDFLAVHRHLFNRCLKEHEEREFAAIRNFVDTHPFFSHWQRRLKRFLEMSVRKEVHEYESVIVKQGQPVTGLYFIYQGQAKVLIDPTKHKSQYRGHWPFEAVTDLYAQEFEWLREARKEAIARKYGQDPTVLQTKNDSLMVRRTEGYAAAERLVHGRTITLCSVSNMEVIGDAEVISKLDTYMQSVVCSSSNTQVYVLDMKNYERLVLKKNPATLPVIKDIVSDKLFNRMNTHQGKQLPILKYLHFKLNEENYRSTKELPPLKTTKSLPDSELLQKYLVKAFIDGKSQICEPYVPGMTYYKELMQDKARIRDNIRANQGYTRHREKLFSEKLKNRKPRSSAALKEALDLMEDEDMIAWRNQIGKDFLEMIVPPTKNFSKPKHGVPKKRDARGDRNPRNVQFTFASKKAVEKTDKLVAEDKRTDKSHEGEASTRTQSATAEEGQEEGGVPKTVYIVEHTGETDDSIGSMFAVINDSKHEAKSSVVEDEDETEDKDEDNNRIVEINPTPPTETLQETGSVLKNNKENKKPIMVTHLTAIREDSYLNPEPDDTLAAGETKKDEDNIDPPAGNVIPDVETLPPTDELPVAQEDGGHDMVTEKKAETQTEAQEENKSPLGGRAWGLTRQFVQQKIEKKKQESTLFDDRYSEYKDYETSDRTLNFLENRLRAFHLKYSTSRRPIKLPRLRRFKVDQDELYRTMRQGGRVKIKRRTCDLNQSEYKIKNHQHVHYHMVPKLSHVPDIRKTRMVMQFLVDSSVKKDTENDRVLIESSGNGSDR